MDCRSFDGMFIVIPELAFEPLDQLGFSALVISGLELVKMDDPPREDSLLLAGAEVPPELVQVLVEESYF